MKVVVIRKTIEWCNGECPYFYRNYDDEDSIWCDMLDERVYHDDPMGASEIMFDRKHRPIPKKCPLPDVDGGE